MEKKRLLFGEERHKISGSLKAFEIDVKTRLRQRILGSLLARSTMGTLVMCFVSCSLVI